MAELKETKKYGGKAKMSSGVDPKKRVTPGTNAVEGSKKVGPSGTKLHEPKVAEQFKDAPGKAISGTEGT